jgi:hypothetical protein
MINPLTKSNAPRGREISTSKTSFIAAESGEDVGISSPVEFRVDVISRFGDMKVSQEKRFDIHD